MSHDLQDVLERIANALERIATTLEQPNALSSTRTNKEDKPILNTDDNLLQEIEDLLATDVDTVDPIESFLSSRNVQIKTIPPEDPADNVINSLSLFLGENYDDLKRVLAKIKRHMQKGSFFTENIKDSPQQAISNITQFCNRLHQIAFLEQYRYLKSPNYLIRAKATTLSTAQQFFSGQWLERFVLQKVEIAVNRVSNELETELDFSYLINPQITLPNGNDFELDLIFQVNDKFYWVEAKSGDYQQHISKYAKVATLLGLDYDHAMMVLTDVASDQSAALTALFGMTVYPLDQLEAGLKATLMKDLR